MGAESEFKQSDSTSTLDFPSNCEMSKTIPSPLLLGYIIPHSSSKNLTYIPIYFSKHESLMSLKVQVEQQNYLAVGQLIHHLHGFQLLQRVPGLSGGTALENTTHCLQKHLYPLPVQEVLFILPL